MDQSWVAGNVLLAASFRDRWRGVNAGHRRVLLRTGSVHGRGLAAPFRLVWIDPVGRVVATSRLEPNGLARMPGAYWVLEQPIDEPGPEVGTSLAIYARGCEWETDSVRYTDRQLG